VAQHVGRQIAAARRRAGLTQAELGERMGITQATISEMENTSSVLTDTLDRVASALGVQFIVGSGRNPKSRSQATIPWKRTHGR
jgi:transcriptional regulator with XRE-family HTH domain